MSNNSKIQTKTLAYINRAYLLQKAIAVLDDMRAIKGKRLPTGRRISPSHYWCIEQLLQLAYVDFKNSGLDYLTTNRNNLAAAFRCCPRTTYNILMDFEMLGWIIVTYEYVVMRHEITGKWEERVHIIVRFTMDLIEANTSDTAGEQRSDNSQETIPSSALIPTIGKVCHIHTCEQVKGNTILKKNNQINREKQDVHKSKSRTAKATTTPPQQEEYAVQKRFYKDISAQKVLTQNANFLWRQAFHNLWKSPMWKTSEQKNVSFSHDIQNQCVQFIALALA